MVGFLQLDKCHEIDRKVVTLSSKSTFRLPDCPPPCPHDAPHNVPHHLTQSCNQSGHQSELVWPVTLGPALQQPCWLVQRTTVEAYHSLPVWLTVVLYMPILCNQHNIRVNNSNWHNRASCPDAHCVHTGCAMLMRHRATYGSREWRKLTKPLFFTDFTCAFFKINGGMWMKVYDWPNPVASPCIFNHIPPFIF